MLGTRSELAAALGAYATDHQDHLRLDEVREIRTEYGMPREPSAEALFPPRRVRDGEEMTPSRDERLRGTLEAFASCWLDGLPVTPAAIRDGWDYIEGRRTLDEIVHDAVRRHTRSEGGDPPSS